MSRDAPSSEGYKYPLEDQTIRRIVTAYFPGDNKFQADMCEQAIRKAFRLAAPLKTGAPSAAPAATPLTFDGWWNTDPKDEAGNEYDLEHFYLLREGWRACITHRARPLERENADLRGKLEQAQKDAERWKDYAQHQEICADCGEAVSDCETGSALRDAALKEKSNG